MSSIADSGPPIHLQQIRRLDLLATVSPLTIPKQVQAELGAKSVWKALRRLPRLDVHLHRVSVSAINRERHRSTVGKLSDADVAVLVLARRSPNDLVLTDDLHLRRRVEAIPRRVVGSVGILVRAYRLKKIGSFQLRRGINELLDDSSLYLSSAFRQKVWALIQQLEDR